jgi:hypothetical protein
VTPGRGLVLAILCAAACSAERALPPPRPTGIDPPAGFRSVDVPVVIRGEAFYVAAVHGAGGAEGDRVSAGFRAWLGEVALEEVTWVDEGTLTAVVAAGTVARGPLDLVVEGPYGARGGLPAAYAAEDGQAPLLTVEPVLVPSTVLAGEPAAVHVHVTNGGPGPLRDVTLSVKPTFGPRPDLPGAPAPQELGEGASFDAVLPVSTAVPGTFEYEAKASGYAGANVRVTSEKVRATLEVVAAP